MRSHNDYFLLFPDIIDAANAAATSIIPVPDGGRLTTVYVTEETAFTAADEDLTFSIRNAAGTAVAITTGVLTIDIAASAIGRTLTFNITKQSDGTDVVPPGGSLQVVNDSAATVGTCRVAVVLRR